MVFAKRILLFGYSLLLCLHGVRSFPGTCLKCHSSDAAKSNYHSPLFFDLYLKNSFVPSVVDGLSSKSEASHWSVTTPSVDVIATGRILPVHWTHPFFSVSIIYHTLGPLSTPYCKNCKKYFFELPWQYTKDILHNRPLDPLCALAEKMVCPLPKIPFSRFEAREIPKPSKKNF